LGCPSGKKKEQNAGGGFWAGKRLLKDKNRVNIVRALVVRN